MKIKHTPLKYLTAGQSNTDALIDQLLKKGVLTESEAKELRAAPAAKPAPTPTPTDIRMFWRDGIAPLNYRKGWLIFVL